MDGVIRVGIVAPVLALRAGLRAMLVADSVDPLDPQSPSTITVLDEAASLEDYQPSLPETDVLLVSSESYSPSMLRGVSAEMEGQFSLLLLSDDPATAPDLRGLPLRAWGILPVDVSTNELLAAVYALNEGLVVGTPSAMNPIFKGSMVIGENEDERLFEALTERESQVLELLARGLANKQIAAALGISEHTVKFHVSSIYTKLGVTNRAEAVRVGVQQGLVLL